MRKSFYYLRRVLGSVLVRPSLLDLMAAGMIGVAILIVMFSRGGSGGRGFLPLGISGVVVVLVVFGILWFTKRKDE